MMPIYEGGFIELLEEFLKRLEPSRKLNGSEPKTFDLSREFMLFNFDSMGQFCFGEKFGSMQTPKNAEIIEKTHGGFRGLNAVRHAKSIGIFQRKLSMLQNTDRAHAWARMAETRRVNVQH
jgi:hypothetical protein